MSTSFTEMDLEDPADESFKPLSRSSTSSSGSTSSLGTGSGWAERKWLVDETKLLELFKTCSQCGTAIDEKKTSSHGGKIKIRWTFLQGHTGQ